MPWVLFQRKTYFVPDEYFYTLNNCGQRDSCRETQRPYSEFTHKEKIYGKEKKIYHWNSLFSSNFGRMCFLEVRLNIEGIIYWHCHLVFYFREEWKLW